MTRPVTNPTALKQAQHYAAIAASMGLTREAEQQWNYAISYLRDAYEIPNATH